MRPDDRGLLAIGVQQGIERGETPEAARLAALREFGYVPAARDSMRRVWFSRGFDMAEALAQDMRVGLRSLLRAKGMAVTVVITLTGLDEARVVKAGVVSGAFFDVMGLRPVLGRLLTAQDDGLNAAGAAVLTHRFWTTALNSDPSVIGKTSGLGTRTATIVGVLEPSVPYPADTEMIAPDSYSAKAGMKLSATPLRDQITLPTRTILLLLLAAASVVFIIACSNGANLILARSVRRAGELAVRAALGASRGALRRTLLAESLVLCGAGAVLGVILARPFVAAVASFAARFSVRALDVAVDSSVLWVGSGLAVAAAVVLAYVPSGVLGGYALAALAAASISGFELPGVMTTLGAAVVLAGAAVLASLMPAVRASRVDVLQALRSE